MFNPKEKVLLERVINTYILKNWDIADEQAKYKSKKYDMCIEENNMLREILKKCDMNLCEEAQQRF